MSKKPSLDGFYPRRPNTRSQVGQIGFSGNQDTPSRSDSPLVLRPSHQASVQRNVNDTFTVPHPGGVDEHMGQTGLSRSELEESLRGIDEEEATLADYPEKRSKKVNKGKRPMRVRRVVKWLLLLIVVGALAIGGYTVIKGILASNSIFKGDIFGLVQQRALKQDANGRTNILIFGTSEDDEGGNHPGAYLTDSIMLLSVNQTKKDAYMVGIPRDLWVKYDEPCYGSAAKINALYQCVSNDGSDDAAGSKALTQKVSEVTGLDVQYYAHVNYSVVRDAVDAVGGIDITIPDYDPGAPGIYDPNFDWKCHYTCKMVYYKDGERAHMDGEHALAFARARNSEGGYGLPHGNFDREKDQQLVLVALKDKALSVGTLTNFVTVTKLLDAMGSNLRTNIETAEIRTIMSLASDIKTDAIHSIDLNKDGESVMTTGSSEDGQSIVRPISGLYDYTGIAKYIKKQILSEPFMLEDALVVVLNGSGVAGQGAIVSDKLSDIGFNMAVPQNAPNGEYARREVYARDATKYPATLKKLQSLYGTVKTSGIDKFDVSSDIDFVVVVGKADDATQ